MADRTPMGITTEYCRKKRKEKEESEQKEYEKTCYGSWCKHEVTDENQGMIFCVECGVVTQDQIFNSGGGSYGSWRRDTAKEKKQKRQDKKDRSDPKRK